MHLSLTGTLKKDPELTSFPFEQRFREHKFVPEGEISPMSEFMRRCLWLDPIYRYTAHETLSDPWLQGLE